MEKFLVKPAIYQFQKAEEFAKTFNLNEDDLVITNKYIYEPYFGNLGLKCHVLYQENYGKGEPSDAMVEAMYKDVTCTPKRIIAIGGGTIMDISKIFSLRKMYPILDLFDGKIVPEKEKELILVPTTCGTGSEVTNVAVLSLLTRGTKKGLASDEMYADAAVLVPELLNALPFSVFATSSIDALIHAVESSLSPDANQTTRMFGYRAIDMILHGYQKVVKEGKESLHSVLPDYLLASNYAGISFGNAGCAAVHALSYPIGSNFHVPHGEANYAIFTGVMRAYMKVRQDGEIKTLNNYIADILGCDPDHVYDELEKLLNQILPKKPLHAYGMKQEQIEEFTDSVIANQQRLLKHSFVPLDRDQIIAIYTELY